MKTITIGKIRSPNRIRQFMNITSSRRADFLAYGGADLLIRSAPLFCAYFCTYFCVYFALRLQYAPEAMKIAAARTKIATTR